MAPSHFNPGVDAELDAVILAALAQDSSQRPASLRVLEGALDAVFEELELTPSGDELANFVAKVPRRSATPSAAPMQARRVPPAGWYAPSEEFEDDSTASQVLSWQMQESERKWMVGISVVLVALALLWALWPAAKSGNASRGDAPAARVSSRH